MKQSTVHALHLEPRTDDELKQAISRFEAKWQHKVERADREF